MAYEDKFVTWRINRISMEFCRRTTNSSAYQSKHNGNSAGHENRRMCSLACDVYPGLTLLPPSSACSEDLISVLTPRYHIAHRRDGQMSAIVIRNLSPETHRALQARAARHGRSTEAEARIILDDAVRPRQRVKLGSALAAFGRSVGGLDLDISRDSTPAMPIDLE